MKPILLLIAQSHSRSFDLPPLHHVPPSVSLYKTQTLPASHAHLTRSDFTAVIGPNGSGKSNLMDAISFVLGVRTNQLRGNQLKELLYQNSEGNTEEDKPRRGFVKLVYLTEGRTEISFGRLIQPTSSEPDASHQSVYKINDRSVRDAHDVVASMHGAHASSRGALLQDRLMGRLQHQTQLLRGARQSPELPRLPGGSFSLAFVSSPLDFEFDIPPF